MKKIPIIKAAPIPLLTVYFLFTPLLGLKMNANTPTDDGTYYQYLQSAISGTISDTDGRPVAGVTIQVGETKTGTISELDGSYSIQVPLDSHLIFSAIGYKTESIPVNGRQEINVILQEDVTQLDEVVLNAGYYSIKDKERTGNISTIKADVIEKQPVANPLSAMQGHLSGVNIVQNTGVPGGGFSIKIRGRNFINGVSDPLFIVDGVPFGSQSLGDFQISGQIVGGNISPLNAINPNDIKSIEVLKDADATAIYGSRGANGVVLITTKKGRPGKTRFDAHLSTTMGKVSHFLDLLDTQQYLEIRREGIQNDGFEDQLEGSLFDFFWPDVKLWENDRYTDWQKELIGRTAYRNNAQLSISGGSDNTQFLISGAYQKETTVFPGEFNYRKANIHSNVNHHSTDNRFKISLSTSYAHEDNFMPRTDFTVKAYSLEPNAPALYDDEGNLNWENNTWENPMASLEERFGSVSKTLISNAMVSYTIRPNLKLRSSIGFTNYRGLTIFNWTIR